MKDILECIAIFLLIVLVVILQKSEVQEVKERYKISEQNNIELIKENDKLVKENQELKSKRGN